MSTMAYELGYEAFYDVYSLGCPYDEGSDDSLQWWRGYNAAWDTQYGK